MSKEVGVNVNNILTFLVLAVMSWVGYNINAVKMDIAEISGYLQTHEIRISRNERDIKDIKSVSNNNSIRLYKTEK